MALPTLSVVVANYNHGKYLPDALGCIIGQSEPPLEVLVVDDGSTDRSVKIIEEFARRHPIVKLVRNPRNRGVVYTFNRGLALARGDYVYGAAADDKVLPGFFAEALHMAALHPQAGMIFADVVQVDEKGDTLARFGLSGRTERMFFTPQAFLDDYLATEPPGHSLCGATIYRRDRLLEFGGYPDGLGSWVDTFVTRAIGLKYGGCYVPRPFMQWRFSPNSLANRTTTWDALRMVARAARMMRSKAFRDCFPERYVRHWTESYLTYLLRQHVSRLPERREVFQRQAAERLARTTALLGRIKRLPILNIPFILFPSLEVHCASFLQARLLKSAERRLQREERELYRRLDPALRHHSAARRLCASIALPAQRYAPLLPSDIEPNGGHGYRVDLDKVGVFAPSDEESVSQLRIFEDGKGLARPHCPHDAIRGSGEGRFSHWGNFLYVSSSDNSDPRRNGRCYMIEAPRTLLSCARSLVAGRRTRKAA